MPNDDSASPKMLILMHSARTSHPVRAPVGQLPIVRSIRADTGQGGPPRCHMDLRGRGRSEITPPGSYGWDRPSGLLEIADCTGPIRSTWSGSTGGSSDDAGMVAVRRRRWRA